MRMNCFSMRAGLKAAALSVSVAALSAVAASAQELNALVWCDHTDAALIEPFEREHGVKVNLKVFEGTGAGLSLLDQSRAGEWDVMVIDSIDVPRIAQERFLPLPEAELPLDDQFEVVRMDDILTIDGERYAVTEKFGFNAMGEGPSFRIVVVRATASSGTGRTPSR